MPEKPRKLDTSKPARAAIGKISKEERREIRNIVNQALNDRDLPKFKEGLARLGYVESSAEYAKLLELWEDFWRASRHD